MRVRCLIAVLLLAVACQRSETPSASAAKPKTPVRTEPQQEAAVEVGRPMPAYAATRIDGQPFDLAGERDKVVLLNLWATWCGPCRFEIPELEAMHKEYAAKGFEVVGVSVDEGGAEGVRDFVKEQQMTYPIVLDPEGKLATVFQTSVLPTSALVDRKGRVVWKKYGLITPSDPELKKAIESALSSS
jgi:cytochrome c-type biogenesis protein